MHLKFNNEKPIYLQMIEQLELDIVSGRLPPGSQLPTIRELANQAKINVNTVTRALAELEELNLITTKRTNGKFVTNNQKRIIKCREKLAETTTHEYLKTMQSLGFNTKELLKYLKERS